jgi:hypothetical protein
VQNLYESSFPLCSISRKASRNQLWVTTDIKKSSAIKNKLYKTWLHTKKTDDFIKYKSYRNLFTNIVRNAKKDYYSKLFNKNTNSVKNIWHELNKLCNPAKTKKNLSGPSSITYNNSTITDASGIVNAFNSYFASVGAILASNIPQGNNDNYTRFLGAPCPNTFFCENISELEVLEELKKHKITNKSTYESLKPSVLLSVADIIVPPLTYIYNISLEQGTFPEKLKIARVIPVFKKGDAGEISNYRPISLLSVFDKIFEKIICSKLYKFLNKYNILYKHQYGFRQNHSTTSALTEISDYIYNSLDENYYVLGLYLDISKAFDSVSHSILLNKLYHYGVRGNIHCWFQSYLSDRKQFVALNNCRSDVTSIEFGVPQGSTLGPLLFLLYINDIHYSTVVGEMRLFADDANHFIRDTNYLNLQRSAEIELAHITNWMNANLLTVNISKTNYTVFSPTVKPLDFNVLNCITFGNEQIQRARNIKYLGVVIDEGLLWIDHIKYICDKIRRFCGIFFKIRCFVPPHCLRMLYFSLVYSHVQYASEIFANTSQSNLYDLKVLINRILRTLQHGNCRTKISQLFRTYNTLPVHLLHEFRLSLFVYKFLFHRDSLPPSFQNYFRQNFSVHGHNTRTSFNIHIKRFLSRFGKRSLVYRAATIWNNLPTDLKSVTSLHQFKKRLLLHYLNTM